jgi:replicative DNA helicase
MDWLSVHSPQAVAEVATRLSEPAKIVTTGLRGIDSHLWYWGDRRGIPRGEYVVVGGASNSGKTMLGLYLTKRAMMAGEKCAVISMDMRRDDLLLRLFQSMDGGVDRRDWIPSRWTADHTRSLSTTVRDHRAGMEGDILIGERKSSDFAGIQNEINELIEKEGVTWILVDHLQKIRIPGVSNMADRVEIIGEDLADRSFYNRVTICALSQLTGSASRDFTRSPTMYDLYGGTGVGSNASLCFVCDHTLYEPLLASPHMARTWVTFSKNRMGPKGHRVPIMWDYANLTVRQAERGEEEAWPNH